MSAVDEIHRSGNGVEKAGVQGRLVLDRFLPYTLAVLGDHVSRLLGRAYADAEDLTIPEWRVLAVISELDPAAARDVVARTPMDKMSVSRAVVSLEAKGLVTREPSPSDRRSNVLRMTQAGRERFARVAAIALAHEEAILEALTQEETAEISRLLGKLMARVDALSPGLNETGES